MPGTRENIAKAKDDSIPAGYTKVDRGGGRRLAPEVNAEPIFALQVLPQEGTHHA